MSDWPGGTENEALFGVLSALRRREQLRREQSFAVADIVRDDLESRGWKVSDGREAPPGIVREWRGRFLSVTVATGDSAAKLELKASVV